MHTNIRKLVFSTFSLSLLLATVNTWAQPQTFDEDLAPAPIRIREDVPLQLPADQTEAVAGQEGTVSFEILRQDHDRTLPVTGLHVSLTSSAEGGAPLEDAATTDERGFTTPLACQPGTTLQGTVSLVSGNYFRVTNGSDPYQVVFQAPCGQHLRLLFNQASHGGQALGIWQILYLAQTKLEHAVGLGFWRNNINVTWPGDANYYSWGTVNVTNGDWWDVVGHELGHAIYDQASIGAFGGGQHKIDECYSNALALSEGWASYFSAWLSVDLNDADAKFEYMVPRRAPIRFETVPTDVCQGPTNEWRVTSYFWDLIDLHEDSETANETFARVWNALLDGQVSSVTAAHNRLATAGLSRELLDTVWSLNFQTATPREGDDGEGGNGK